MATTAKQKAAASNVSFELFGLMSLSADLVPARDTESRKAVAFKSLCPTCPAPTKVNQFYSCPENHGPFTVVDLVRKAKEIGGDLIEVSAAELNEVKTGSPDEPVSGEKKVTSLAWFAAPTVEAATRPGDLAYRLRPGKTTALATYLGFRELLSNRDVAFVGTVTLRGVERMFRLEVWGDQIFAQSLLWPDDLAERDEIVGEVADTEMLTLAKELIGARMADFDPSLYRNGQRERADILVAAKIADPTAVVVTAAPAPATENIDVIAALKAMLEVKTAKTEAA